MLPEDIATEANEGELTVAWTWNGEGYEETVPLTHDGWDFDADVVLVDGDDVWAEERHSEEKLVSLYQSGASWRTELHTGDDAHSDLDALGEVVWRREGDD